MNNDQAQQLAALRSQRAPGWLATSLYDMQLPDDLLVNHFVAWTTRFPFTQPVIAEDGSWFDRHAFELFMQNRRLMPMRLAAARLGMTRRSLELVLTALEQNNWIVRNTLHFSDQIIYDGFLKEIVQLFPDLRNRIFSSHDNFCTRLHDAIGNDTGVRVDQLKCETAQYLEQDDFAYSYDAITGQPIGIRYEVWLDLGKPIRLRPDSCSSLLYWSNRGELAPHVFGGTEPPRPEGL